MGEFWGTFLSFLAISCHAHGLNGPQKFPLGVHRWSASPASIAGVTRNVL